MTLGQHLVRCMHAESELTRNCTQKSVKNLSK